MPRRCPWLAAAVTAVLLLGACAEDEPTADADRIVLNPPAESADHTHAPGQGDPAPIGDGTRVTAGGYRLTDVRLPRRIGGPGRLTFRVLGPDGRAATDFSEQQTKRVHLYVVRADYAVYRHLHPSPRRDGTWSVPVDLDEPGEYRVVVDFLPAGAQQPVVLGDVAVVPGRWRRASLAEGGDDGVVQVAVDGTASVGDDGRLHLVVTTLGGEPVTLGRYLGTTAHVSGFRIRGRSVRDREFVHVHPYDEPEVGATGTELTFHTTFARAGDYRLFVQVRVDGLLHTVPVTATVTP